MGRHQMLALLLVLGCVAACEPTLDGPPTQTTNGSELAEPSTARLLFAGDVMLGRRVAPVLTSEGPGVFEAIRHVVSSADVAAANLESPLTERPHTSVNPNALEAHPSAAGFFAGAGFDIAILANNHSGDAGPEGLVDTLETLSSAGMKPLGAGLSALAAGQPLESEVNGLRIAQLAFDVTGLGLEAGESTPGVTLYEEEIARASVEDAATTSDVVTVAIHGGVEYLGEDDPILGDVAEDLVDWGADIVWGHGPHVPQPVEVTQEGALIATSLGNFLFDQQRPATQNGLILEVLVSVDGVEAYRVGRVYHADLRASFVGWDLPEGSAVSIDSEWWSLVSPPELPGEAPLTLAAFPLGDVVYAATGDVTGDARSDVVVSYRYPFRVNEVNSLFPDRVFTDSHGRSAHLGVFDSESLAPVWVAGTLLRPVAELAACDGSIALAFDTLDERGIVATGAWTWWDFGFATAPELPGAGTPTCEDVDRDGMADPVVMRDGLG